MTVKINGLLTALFAFDFAAFLWYYPTILLTLIILHIAHKDESVRGLCISKHGRARL